MDTLFTLLAGAAIVATVLTVIVSIALYILASLGNYYVFKRLNFEYAWLAWIPIASAVVLGLLAQDEESQITIFGQKLPGIIVALYMIWAGVLNNVPYIGSILALACTIILGGTINAIIFAKMEGKTQQETQVMGYISGFIGIVRIVKFFQYRLKKM